MSPPNKLGVNGIAIAAGADTMTVATTVKRRFGMDFILLFSHNMGRDKLVVPSYPLP